MCDLNKASLGEIAALPEVNYSEALAIQLWRPYRSWDDVRDIPGFDDGTLQKLEDAGAVLREAPQLPSVRRFELSRQDREDQHSGATG